MFTEKFKKYKKAFVFGTGGGNDIVSAIIPALHLQKYGIKTDIGGVLSPAAKHIFNGSPEKVINPILDAKRFIETSDGLKEISFIDNYIPNATKGIIDADFYDISIRFGTKSLVSEFNKFIEDNGYDLVVAVDVGGDILGDESDPHLLSPMMDFTSLYLLRNLKVDNYLIEFGVGTDGELRPGRIEDILYNDLVNHILKISDIRIDDDEVIKFKQVFDNIKHIRTGHTNVMLLKTLQTSDDIITEYRHRTIIDEKKWHHKFMVILKNEYHGKVWLFDGAGVSIQRKKTAFSYRSPTEQLLKLKNICPYWKTELDMFTVDGIYHLTPSLMINPDIRKEIIDKSKHKNYIINKHNLDNQTN